MKRRRLISLVPAALLAWNASDAFAQLKAFPGAEGFGAFAAGGRGGDVYHVTSLADTNTPGTFRYGVNNAPAAGRTIVFDVSGTIDMASDLTISKPKLTIAGQTAPGGGIMLRGWQSTVGASDVIMRYVRFRPGDEHGPLNQPPPNFQGDSLDTRYAKNSIIDHVSTAWSIDENLSSTWSDNVTIQNCVIAEALKNAGHDDGAGGVEPHSMGSLFGYTDTTWPGHLSVHHNLYISNDTRNPRAGDSIHLDFVNNVIYNWGGRCGYSGAATEGTPQINYVNNYLIAGPSTTSGHTAEAFYGGSTNTQIYQSGNLIDSNKNAVRDGANTGWAMFTGAYTQMATPFGYMAVPTDPAATAYARVLAGAGASNVRDSVDTRLVNNVVNTTGAIIDSQNQVGGYPVITPIARPAGWDADNDGMPNWWESARGSNPSVADNNAVGPNGYTNLENYLNYLTLVANWSADVGGAWSGYPNWTGTLPNATDATAIFGPVITAPRTVTLDAPQTVGQLSFDSASAYRISGSSALTLDVISGSATIDVASGSHSIAAPLLLSDNTTITVSQASSTLTLSNFDAGSSSVTKAGAGTLLVNRVRGNTLTVTQGTLRMLPNGSASGASRVASLSVAAAAILDLADNTLIVAGGDVAAITGLIASGRNGGGWSGSGIVTSQSSAASSNFTTIGIATAGQIAGIAGTATTTWGGQTVTGTDTLIMYTYGGDANLDGKINVDDYGRIDFNVPLGSNGWFNGDFNYDGKINVDDYGIIDFNVGLQGEALLTTGGVETIAAVPEPAIPLATALIAIKLTRRRRHPKR